MGGAESRGQNEDDNAEKIDPKLAQEQKEDVCCASLLSHHYFCCGLCGPWNMITVEHFL